MEPLKGSLILDPSRKAFSLLDEFRRFAFKGNMIDLAVAVVLGTAFGKIIESLVKNILMPLLSVVLPGEQGYTQWEAWIGEVKIPYGLFLGELVNFVIVAFAMFLFIVKFLGWVTRLRKEEALARPALSMDQMLLTEIRDLLKQQAERR